MVSVPYGSLDLPIRLRPACGHDGTWSVAELALVIRQASVVGVRHRCVSCARHMITRLPSPTHARILSSLGVAWISESDVLVELS
jgi:hypothetical protein